MLGAVERAWGTAVFEEKEYRTLEYARDIVAAYSVAYAPSTWDFTLVMNERYLEDATECGIVDRVVRRKADGQLYVLDLKTTGLWVSNLAWQEQWRHSQQAARYLKLVEHYFQEQWESHEFAETRVAGFWCDAIHVNRRGYPKADDFVRVGPFSYSSALRAELDAHRAVKGARLARLLDNTEAEVPLKNTRNCFRYNSVCTFLRFCIADPAERADMLALALATGELVAKEWNPKEREQ